MLNEWESGKGCFEILDFLTIRSRCVCDSRTVTALKGDDDLDSKFDLLKDSAHLLSITPYGAIQETGSPSHPFLKLSVWEFGNTFEDTRSSILDQWGSYFSS